MQSKITAYNNGMYHSKKHEQVFTGKQIAKAIGRNGLNFIVEDKDTKEDVTEKHLVYFTSRALFNLSKENKTALFGRIKKECLKILAEIEKEA